MYLSQSKQQQQQPIIYTKTANLLNKMQGFENQSRSGLEFESRGGGFDFYSGSYSLPQFISTAILQNRKS